MKLNFEKSSNLTVSSYHPGRIVVNGKTYDEPVVIFNDRVITRLLPSKLGELNARHIEEMLKYQPEIVLLGTGKTQQFITDKLIMPLYEQAVGFESMNTGAACRSFNVLVCEGRAVLCALYMVEQ